MRRLFLFAFSFCLISSAKAQLFEKITDAGNPINSDSPESFYEGASWVDYDNDCWLDLYVTRKALYHNDGNSEFTKVTTSGLKTNFGLANTWSDCDNDGDIDCFIAGGTTKGSFLYTNNGDGTFTRNISGALFDSLGLKGWSAAWGDYDKDGLTDVVVVAPLGFISITDGNKLLHNDGNGNFSKDESTIITQGTAPYTVGTWYDYDLDGDDDLFIGSGPVNGSLEPDYLYKNLLTETESATFDAPIPAPLTDPRDGQVWNWIDFDNDGDLDGYVTNYVGLNATNGYPNDFYRNDNGTFVKLTGTDVGPIVTDSYISLADDWEDFDNDGDLDCIVINDGADPNIYYRNNLMENGSTVFTKVINEPFYNSSSGSSFSCTAGDYDKDGDLDLFVSSASQAKGLYRNDNNNGNSWVNIRLEGVASNRSAIGAIVKAKATINGNPVWQMREVTAQNTFNGMNSLNVEFGFGNATQIDSVIIKYPSGQMDVSTNVAINQFYYAKEGFSLSPVGIFEHPDHLNAWLEVYPNPASASCRVRTVSSHPGNCKVSLCDITGKIVRVIFEGRLTSLSCVFDLNLDTLDQGVYILRLDFDSLHANRELVIVK